jgi:cyclase
MLIKRIIPCLDLQAGRVVKNVRFFADHRDAGDPVALAERYEEQGADELVLYDIKASAEGRRLTLEAVSKVAERVMMPLTVGGGVAGVGDFRALLLAGADKVSVNSAALRRPALIAEAAEHFGSQCVVLSVDAKRGSGPLPRWEVFAQGGGQATGTDLLEWVVQGERLGAGEIVLNVMDADGTQEGFDLLATRLVAEAVGIPVVASGGAGRLQDFVQVLQEGKADAALAATVLHFGTFTIPQIKDYLAASGVSVRRGLHA